MDGRDVVGDMLAPEAERRGGATPLAEWREFNDAFRRRAGVPARESRPLLGLKELLRDAALTLRAEGDR